MKSTRISYAIFLSTIVTLSAVGHYGVDSAAATSANSSPTNTTSVVSSSSVVKFTLKSGVNQTVNLSVPNDVTSAKVRITGAGAWRESTIRVCEGAVMTKECSSKTLMKVKASSGVGSIATVDIPVKDGKATFRADNASTRIELEVLSTTAPPKPVIHVNLPPEQINGDTVGVPSDRTLTPYTGVLTITKDNTVIDNMDIKGRVVVKANNVTIKNTKIRGQESVYVGLIDARSGNTGLKVIDTEIFSELRNPNTNGIMGGNFTLERVNIHDVVDQVHITTLGNVQILHSWLHSNVHYENDPNWNGGPSHDDNIQLIGGSNILIKNSRIEGSKNAAVMAGQNNAAIKNLVLDGNLLGGGACTVNIGPKNFGAMAGYGNVIKNNKFQRNQTKHIGCAVIVPNGSAPTMSNNIWTDTGLTVAVTRG